MATIQFKLKDELKERLEVALQADNRDQDEFLNELLEQALICEDIDRLRKKFVPRAVKQGIVTDQDVFDIVS